jgi:hypothetical protein
VGKAYLDQVLAFGLGDERLQLGGGEGIDQSGLGDDKEEHLGSGEDRQLVGLVATMLVRTIRGK